ncbi:MAG: Hsp20/alpha crystallin family protein [Patescibacteria group bacterium]
MSNLQTIMDSFFDDVRPLVYRQASSLALPALNVKEFDDRYEISITIPGIDANKIKVELVEKVLNVSYDHTEEEKEKNTNLIREEFRHYSFNRSVNLPRMVDPSSVKATSKNGILSITIKKSPDAQPKVIEIEHL